MLPFQSDVADDEDPLLMIRIIPELRHIFKTKERVPFKLVCETVKYSEIRASEESDQPLEYLPVKDDCHILQAPPSHMK